ncbi:MAG: helix-turn-helix domain-containing protein [Henriciella sp.]
MERAVRNPTLTVIERIAKALGISLSELFDQSRRN